MQHTSHNGLGGNRNIFLKQFISPLCFYKYEAFFSESGPGAASQLKITSSS